MSCSVISTSCGTCDSAVEFTGKTKTPQKGGELHPNHNLSRCDPSLCTLNDFKHSQGRDSLLRSGWQKNSDLHIFKPVPVADIGNRSQVSGVLTEP